MALDVVTNVASLNAQTSLEKTTMALQTNFARLSSGLRINSAADDAAGLAIADRFAVQIRSVAQAKRNANDGVSLLQTADGGLSQMTGILTRMRELAVESANGTLSSTDRSSLNSEATSIRSELDRIANTTTFNGVNLLGSGAGAAGAIGMQVGTGNNSTSNDQVAVQLFTGTNTKSDFSATTYASPDTLFTGTGALQVKLASGTTVAVNYTASDTLNTLAASINGTGALSSAGVSAKVVSTGPTTYQLELSYGSKALASVNPLVDTGTMLGAPAAAVAGAGGLADATSASLGTVAGATALSSIDLTTSANALTAIGTIDNALTDLNSIRSTVGQSQNRLNIAIGSLNSKYDNFSAAEGRIRNVDVASETASLTRNQILIQAGTAILAQANQSAQSALSLLK